MPAEVLLRLALASSLAITNVTVIDPSSGKAIPDQSVVVADGRIQVVGATPAVAVPDGAERVDGTGRFLIPGLCDMHVHSGPYDAGLRMARLLVANGITCVRDMGSPPDDVIRLRDDIRAGRTIGPDMVVAGPLLLPALPPSLAGNPMLLGAASGAEARAAVRRLETRGVDFIKVSGSLPRAVYLAVAAECRQAHLRFAGHVPPGVTAAEAAEAGQASIEHFGGGDNPAVLLSCSRREAVLGGAARDMLAEAVKAVWAGRAPDDAAPLRAVFVRPLLDSFDPRRAGRLLATFERRGTWQTPTLMALRRSRNAAVGLTAADRAAIEALTARERDLVRMMRDAGVGLLAGTDLPLRGAESPLADELVALVEAGLAPAEALRAATSGAAAFLRRNDAGRVTAGARADLVLLDADPLRDVANVRKIVAVVARGRLLREAELADLRRP